MVRDLFLVWVFFCFVLVYFCVDVNVCVFWFYFCRLVIWFLDIFDDI